MRMRTWIFAVVVALVLAINLVLLSLRIAQTGEETVRARVALASTALKGQLELIDARLSPRAVATNPDLIDATRPPIDPTVPLGKPDERALRAAASALSPEPDLLIVATSHGAIVSRRAKAAQVVDNAAALPLVKSGLEGAPAASFAAMDGALYRVAAARIPGNAALVVVGMLVDDRMAAQLRSQIDADVTLLQAGKPLASSLPAEERARVARWAAAPAPGYGVLQVRMPLIGSALSGWLPRGATRYAVRGALVPLDAGVQAAVTVPASPYLGWLGRYQAFYLLALLAFLLLSFLWGQLAGAPVVAAPEPQPNRRLWPPPAPAVQEPGPQPSLDVGNPVVPAVAPALRDVPWREGEGPSGEHATPPPPIPPHHEAGAVAAFTEAPAAPPLAPAARGDEQKPAEVSAAPDAGKRDFSFADLIDERRAPPEPAAEEHPSLHQDSPEIAPALPGDELIAPSKTDFGRPDPGAPGYLPGDEPTRIEPLSAALLDKLREKDEPDAGETEPLPESAFDAASRAMPPGAGHTMPAAEPFAMSPELSSDSLAAESDPDEPHWQETFDQFRELKERLGEPVDRISFGKFSARLRKNRADLMAKHSCKGVRFVVYEKDGRAAIRASALR